MILKNIIKIFLLIFFYSTSSFSSGPDDHLAISGDYVFSHHEWAKQQNFPFKLLSDYHHKVGKLYDSYIPERGFNKRTVFIVDKLGQIAYKNMNYSVADERDFEALKEALQKLL